ncbi:conserved hypothetical protein (plasmid) [Rhizobium leguminosarum bv. trifolii WSM2304]|uniref:Uncharacterized protein n=1 Tax=Rhizobium leguminosarum bv. trifolii (strain WSM2304) TaxID=395492 RepID=A0ABF7QW02_RHILW|nr:hypothetical protein [Rhizobium leguminosarum]ACI58350.1 conserved hypothetical protein [Rhizobium leguminosarum bv. trifolii WSM2304]
MSRGAEEDNLIMSKAVRAWYRHCGVYWDDQASAFLCDAAIGLYNEGYRSVEEMATVLIGTIVGLVATRVNAPSSDSVH